MKLFAAIRPPDDIIWQLAHIQKGVKDAKWSDPEKLHLTLAFFGDVDPDHAEILDQQLGHIRLPGFDIHLAGMGHFGNSEPHALWAGVTPSQKLTALHEKCKKAARLSGLEIEKRVYTPHITLAYLRRNPDIMEIAKFERRLSGFKAGPFLADQFYLYSSHEQRSGPNQYRIEASYPLRG
jgi:2'-5' RNA ligase